jgi:dTDP-L-rhamnose 4-epimerase
MLVDGREVASRSGPVRERVLITGGAGFIGSHLADLLLSSGREVMAYDNLDPQVHGHAQRPVYLAPEVELLYGDVRDADKLAPHLRRADVVVHFAAAVGVGQSMYEIRRYTDVNALGVATLLQLLADDRGKVRKLLVASSMSIYGEGAYQCPEHGLVAPRLRPAEQLAAREWDMRCPRCGAAVEPLPTAEEKPLYPTSVYAVNKRDHEELCLAVGAAHRIPTVALRFFNVYGSRQALSNPYTGVAAIFCARLRNGNRPLVYEDGGQSRDFVHVSDVARACLLALESPGADGEAINIGTGRQVPVLDLAGILAAALDRPHLSPTLTNLYRAGDIRHCFAEITKAGRLLGYTPRVALEDGLGELVEWVPDQRAVDRVLRAAEELAARQLAR